MKIATDKVAEIIILARDLNNRRAEFDGFVSRLTDGEQASLVALMWIGRGSFEAEEWDEAYQTAQAEATIPTEDYLIGTPLVADHLENGLDAMGVSAASEEGDLD